jgi:DNA primase
MNLLDLVSEDTGTPAGRPVSHGAKGEEHHGPCPWCGGRDRFITWPDHGRSGSFWCRSCGKGGDGIQYAREKRGLGFRDACAVFGVDPGEPTPAGRREHRPPPSPDPLRTPREPQAPPTAWQEKAAAVVEWASGNLWTDAGAGERAYLAGRGLTEETIRAARLGWIPAPMYRPRKAWGLEDEPPGEDGRPRTRIMIPAGIVIPWPAEGAPVRLRVRTNGEPRYRMVKGSAAGPCMAWGTGAPVVVVEGELDALLLGQEAGDLVTAVALGSDRTNPDPDTAARMRAAPVVMVSLDSDEAGAGAAWGKWTHTPNARRWPVPPDMGKDPTDAYRAGGDLRGWIVGGLAAFLGPAENVDNVELVRVGDDDPLTAAPLGEPQEQPPAAPSADFLTWLVPEAWGRLDVAMPRTLAKLRTWPPPLDAGDRARLVRWIPAAVDALGILATTDPTRARRLARDLVTLETAALGGAS